MSDCQLESDNTHEDVEIDHTSLLSQDIGSLFMQEQCSDLVLVIQGYRFPVHKVVLASRSEYFRALLYGGMKEAADSEIELKSSNAEAFKHLLKYIYTGKICLVDLKEDTILDILSLANQYAFLKLQTAISDKLKISLTTANVCSIFDASHLYNLENLFDTCIHFMDRYAVEVIKTDAFYALSAPSLELLLSRDSFCAPEVEIFKAVKLWADFNNEHNSNINNNISNTVISVVTSQSSARGAEVQHQVDLATACNESNGEDNRNNNNDNLSRNKNSSKNKVNINSINIIDDLNSNGNLSNGNTNNETEKENDDSKFESDNKLIEHLTMNDDDSFEDYEEEFKSNNYDNDDDETITRIKKLVRLPLISLEELLNVVRPADFISADQILDAIKQQHETKRNDLPHRGSMLPMENVACARHNAKVIQGDMNMNLLDINSSNSSNCYHLDQGYTSHAIDDHGSNGIVIELGSQYIINHITMLLWDRDTRSYSYFIEVSMDNKEWIRVVDMSKYLCRSKQQLRFKQRVVKYIKIVGTHNSVNRFFHIIHFECFYNPTPCKFVNNLIVPENNVASIECNAWVVEGVSRSRNALINGNTTDYDWDSGYTCHQLGSGSIVIQLAQPYVIGSMRLLLWDCDNRTYSYFIEVSNDQQTWTKIADRTKEACVSWQIITFNPTVITFIRIMGTHNTANEVFHCVHFECPVEESLLNNYKLRQNDRHQKSPVHSSSSSTLNNVQRQPSYPRYQGLHRYETMGDSDGYGVGFLGGGGSSMNGPI